ncbi:IPTL-CTERM sorting domain-containing protein [Pulveribacter suum]|uniref:IPTL-CTERM protein sorting domain-containing protein n=1 Tax=Pulveribacter suum TaxID=2116657 RepID=A0A2P1NJ80_9BURK|nr:IPTL-CTERM sorting domain-containing protein [Pulveribacter suum]AVP57138.1 hypothetical protein C7H73_05315 [Pulveribacter suum]
MQITSVMRYLRASARRWLPGGGGAARAKWGLAAALLAAPLAHAGFENGGFEEGDFNHWTLKSYTRAALPSAPPPTNSLTPITLSALGLSAESSGSATSAVLNAPVANVPYTVAGTLTAPRWGNHAARVNDQGAKVASSIEQTATMTQADVDPVDKKVHVRFGMAPVLADGAHPGAQQPYFYVEVRNNTKGTVLFQTFNYANQSGVPWQKYNGPAGGGWGGGVGDYRYTDWQGFDIAPGQGLLDPGDSVTLIVYASNCSQGAAYHEARVYLDAVGAFMPGLAVAATGPSTTEPGQDVTYNYNYSNNSGVIALGTKVRLAAPKTEDGQYTTFVNASIPGNCTGPHAGDVLSSGPPAVRRGDYIDCDIGLLNDGQSGTIPVSFSVPAGAVTTAPSNVVNNGDYDIRSSTASPFIGPMVKTTILPADATVVDLGVGIDNGGAVSYPPNTDLAATPITVTVSNLSGTDSPNSTVSQTLTGLTGVTWTCAPAPGSTATCGALSGTGPITDTANLPASQSLVYTITGTTEAVGTPVNSVVTVAPAAGTSDSQMGNNTAGMNTPVGVQHNATVNATGSGAGHVLAVPGALDCGNASTACTAAGTVKQVAEGDELRLTPVAHAGSIFKGWTGCTATQGNVCVVTVGTTDVTATAEFAKAYIVTPTQNGMGGSIGPNTPQQVEENGSKVFTLTPDVGKLPVIKPPATGTACTGSLSTTAPYSYTVNPVTQDCGFTVEFVSGVNITSSVNGSGGSISPAGTTGPLVPGNNSTEFTLTPDAGYTPVMGGTCQGTLVGSKYTVTNTASDCTVIASFTNDPVTVTSSVTGGNGGIDTTGTVNLPRGGKRVYTLTPAPSYYPLVTGNCPGKLVGNTYTVDPVNANCTFSVAFSNQTVVLTGTVTDGTGTITPNGPATVAQGGGQTFTAAPGAPGDVVVFGGTCPGTRNGDDFTVANAQSNCTVEAKFVAPANAVAVTTVVTGGTGSVTTPGQDATGKTLLAKGDSRVWALTPGTLGQVPSLAPGSTCTGTLSATAPYTYAVNNAQADCVANFAFAAPAPAGGNVAGIPTLSEWGLVILSSLMGLFMVGMHRRRMF